MRARTWGPRVRPRHWPPLIALLASAPAAAQPHIDYRAALAIDSLSVVSDLAVDAEKNVWVVGTTTSHLLPVTPDAADSEFVAGDVDEGFVLKFDAAGALVYASYLGGRNVDDLAAIALDDDGNVYLAGTTVSEDFPTTLDAYQQTLASPAAEDAFLVKLDAHGQLLASTYFGGTCRDLYPGGSRGNPGVAIALAEDAVYLAGGTCSTDLPTDGGHQQIYGGGTQDAFLARFDRHLAFTRCSYFGGANNEGAYRIAVGAAGDVFLLGVVTRILGEPWSFPATPGTLLDDPPGEPYDFVARFDAAGTPVYATFLGPSGGDGTLLEYQGDLAVDAAGNAYVVGVTQSAGWPTTPGAYQSSLRGFSDLFVSALSPDATHLVWSTYFGGGQAEYANEEPGVRIAALSDALYIAGNTDSTDLPIGDGFERTPSGGFVAKLTLDGGLAYASFVLPYPFGADALIAGRPPFAPPGLGPYIAAYVAGPSVSSGGGVADHLELIGIGELGDGGTACLGDCNGDGSVQINELIVGVNIALGAAAAATCEALDPDGDGVVGIADLIGAVRGALDSCPVP